MGIERLTVRIWEKVREYKLRRELDKIERLYTEDISFVDKHMKKSNISNGKKRTKKRTEKRSKKEKPDWSQLDEYFK